MPEHHEPFPSAEPLSRYWWDMGYSGIPYLRRVAAYLWITGNLPDQPGYVEEDHDKSVMEAYDADLFDEYPPGNFNHLMFHCDLGGVYLPIPFEEVLYSPFRPVPYEGYHCIGSSVQLLEECQHLAKALELPEELLEEIHDRKFCDLFDAQKACLPKSDYSPSNSF